MSPDINLHIEVSIPLDIICAIRNNANTGSGRQARSQIAFIATQTVIDEIKAIPYDIKPIETEKDDIAYEPIAVAVKMSNGSIITIKDIDKNATTTELRRRLHVQTGLLLDRMRLTFRDAALEGENGGNLHHNLWEYGIVDGSSLYLETN